MTNIEKWKEAEGWYGEWLKGDFGFDFNEFLVDKVKTLLQTERTRIAEEVEELLERYCEGDVYTDSIKEKVLSIIKQGK
jgi:hypothetical protein